MARRWHGRIGRGHRPPSVLLLRGWPPRLARPLARRGAARARLFSPAFRHRRCDSRVRGGSRRQGQRLALRSLRPGLCTARLCERPPRVRRGGRLASPSRDAAHDARHDPMPIRSAVSARTAPTGCRNARTRICIFSKPRSLGSRSMTTRLGARMADGIAMLCLEQVHRSRDRRAARVLRRETGRRRRGWKGSICEPGHHYEWAFLLERWAATDRPQYARCGAATDRIRRFSRARCPPRRRNQCGACRRQASTTRWRGCGRRPNAFAPIVDRRPH